MSRRIHEDVKDVQISDYNVLTTKLTEIDWSSVDNIQCSKEIYKYIKNKFDQSYEQSKYIKKIILVAKETRNFA